mgnify:CR=1 FL=1
MGLFDRLKKDESSSAKVTEDKDKKPAVKKTASTVKDTNAKKVVKDAQEENASMKDLYGDIDGKAIKVAGGKEKKEKKYGSAYRILVKPVITEKAAHLGQLNKYVFAVTAGANKIEIAKAINEVYGIKPIDINIIKVRGKKVRSGKVRGKRSGWKKAMVTLPQGKTINIYEGV